ncbi:MAG: hypothetical protein RIT07_29 [Bacteroidota bacterium]
MVVVAAIVETGHTIQMIMVHIYEVVYTQKTMPPAGLTSEELEQFKAWYDSGYPVK